TGSSSMSAERFIANTLRIAAEDLRGARLLRSAHNRNAAYLCEQAAEKLIRAVLTSEGKRAGIGHNLGEFVDLVPDENPLKPRLRGPERLGANPPTTATRRPTASRPPRRTRSWTTSSAKSKLSSRRPRRASASTWQ